MLYLALYQGKSNEHFSNIAISSTENSVAWDTQYHSNSVDRGLLFLWNNREWRDFVGVSLWISGQGGRWDTTKCPCKGPPCDYTVSHKAIQCITVPSSPSDFCPNALLCFLWKVLEKIVHDQVMAYLTRSKILDTFQTGFRKYHSSQSALRKLTDDIRIGKDRKFATLLLPFHFSKEFETISPSKTP